MQPIVLVSLLSLGACVVRPAEGPPPQPPMPPPSAPAPAPTPVVVAEPTPAPVEVPQDPAPPAPIAAPSFDRKGWQLMSSTVVNGKRDRDAFPVDARPSYTKVMFLVEDSDLELFDIVIHFGNGETFSPPTRLVFKEGSRSRAIDLPGKARHIKAIDARYGNLPGGGRARLEVWGKTK
ncbi:MAG: hypothetical protein R2939_01955 [Kofleriaceae bacterium]